MKRLEMACLCITLSAATLVAAKPATLVLSGFEDRSRVWLVGENVSEKSQASVSDERTHSGKYCVKLAYTFDSRPNLLNYVGFGLAAQFAGRPTEFSVWVCGDNSGQPMRLRVTDASSEVFQYWMPDITWTGWKQVTISLGKDQVHWGGDGNGKWDLPLRLDSLLVDSAKEPFESVIYFDDLTYVAEVEPVEQVTVRLETQAFGGVYWGREQAAPPALVLTSASAEQVVSGMADVRVTAPRGKVVFERHVRFAAPPAETWRLPLALPEDTEGLFHVQATLEVEGGKREFTDTFAYFAHPHGSALDANSFFGVCGHFGQGKGDVPRSFDLMSKAGAKWFRDEIYWGACEQAKGQITMPDWADRYMQAAVKHGVMPFILFDYSSDFYDGGNSPTSPEAQEAFGKYCYELVRHFKGVCKHWEVYNEPNIGFWRPKPDPEAYARLLRIAYQSAKRADPTCTVVGVCTAGTDLRFIEEVLKRGGMDFMDALSIHPYRYPGSPEATHFVREVTSAHDLMKKYGGADKRIWLTEIGWPTQKDPSGVSEEMSGNYLVRMHVQAMSLPFVERVIWYDFQDDGPDRKYNEHNFGLLRWQTYAPKQNYVAYKMMTEHLTGAKLERQLLPKDEKDTRYCYKFEREGKPVVIAWCDSGAETLALSLRAKQINLTWADAYREDRKLVDGNLTLALTDMPVFITGGFKEAKLAKARIAIGNVHALAPGETAELRVTAPELGKVALTLDPCPPIEGLKHDAKQPRTYHFTVQKNAQPSKSGVIARLLDVQGRELASAGATLSIVQPLAVSLGAPSARPRSGAVNQPRPLAVLLRVSNTRDVAVDGVRVKLKAGPGMKASCELTPGSDGTALKLDSRATVELPATLTFAADPTAAISPLEVTVTTPAGAQITETFKLGLWEVPRATAPRVIDGRASDWPELPAATLEANESDFFVLRPGAWQGLDDLSVEVRLMWDDAALYVLVEVTDDKHVQKNHGSEVWQSDNVQLAFDYRFAGWKQREAGEPTTYPEIGLTRTDTGDEVYRWLWQEKLSPPIAFKSNREGNLTVYEASIPWAELHARPPDPGDLAGFALIVNEDDGQGRDGWLELYSGIGYGKDPRKFGWVRFAR